MREEKEYKPRTSKTQVGIIEESYLEDKTLDDLIYSYMRIHSYYHIGENFTYCYKSDITAGKIIKYYKENGDNQFPYSENTIRQHIKLLICAGWVYEEIWENKKIYALRELQKKEYITIPLDTLVFLMNTANPNVIKVYSILKNKYKQHIWLKENKDPNIGKFSFSRKSLLKAIGYSFDGGESRRKNGKMIEDILNCLINNNLIEIHEQWETINNNIQTRYFILDKVNDECKKDLNIITESQTPDHNEDSASKKEKQKSLIYVNGYVIKPSKGEEKIKEILESNNIKFEREKTFSTCGNGLFRFDFFLPDMNICIEYDGEQHFRPIEIFGGKEGFDKQITYDNIKNQWCKQNNIKLIRIPYIDYDKISINYLFQKLSFIT